MGRPASTKPCPTCGEQGLKRNGTTSAGRQRWRCTRCGASLTPRRTDKRELVDFTDFLTWIHSTSPQHQLRPGLSPRSFQRHIAWCWQVPTPKPPITGIIYDCIYIDGTYLPHGWCLLLARTDREILNWQWCQRENTASYISLLTPIAPPALVVTDGAKGALNAIAHCWPSTMIQRCLFHVQTNNRTDLTLRPKTPAGKALAALSTQLTSITTPEQAQHWVSLLAQFHTQYRSYLKERTYAKNNPLQASARGKNPSGWWYTHERDRRVYHRLDRLYRKGHLFAYLSITPQIQTAKPPQTTNTVESINKQLKRLIYTHPVASEEHMMAMLEWRLYPFTPTPDQPKEILRK